MIDHENFDRWTIDEMLSVMETCQDLEFKAKLFNKVELSATVIKFLALPEREAVNNAIFYYSRDKELMSLVKKVQNSEENILNICHLFLNAMYLKREDSADACKRKRFIRYYKTQLIIAGFRFEDVNLLAYAKEFGIPEEVVAKHVVAVKNAKTKDERQNAFDKGMHELVAYKTAMYSYN